MAVLPCRPVADDTCKVMSGLGCSGTARGDRGELVLYKLDRPTKVVCVRCAGRSTTRWIAVLAGDWTRLWCKACFLAMPAWPKL
jgi:hypothetical protein